MAEVAQDVFLSYSRDEAPFVRAVADELRRLGVDAWMDESRITVGAAFPDATVDAISSAELVIVFISSKTLDSPSVNFEIGAAVGRGKRVIPIFLSQAARSELPSVLATVAGIDASNLKPAEVAERIASAAEAV